MPEPVFGVWRNPSTRVHHAVIYVDDGVRLACRPNTPTAIDVADVLDYRYCAAPKCWNERCWRHFADPEANDA